MDVCFSAMTLDLCSSYFDGFFCIFTAISHPLGMQYHPTNTDCEKTFLSNSSSS